MRAYWVDTVSRAWQHEDIEEAYAGIFCRTKARSLFSCQRTGVYLVGNLNVPLSLYKGSGQHLRVEPVETLPPEIKMYLFLLGESQ